MSEWKRVKLGEVAKMMRGRAVTRSSIIPGDIPVMLGGREPAYYCNESNHTGPCFIVSRSGASAGYVSYWDEPIFVTDGFLFEANSKNDTQFLYYSLKARQESLIMSQNGTGIPHVRGEDLKNIELAFPAEAKRKRIAAILSDYDAAIANCRKQIALLEEAAMRLYREWFGDGKGEKKRLGDIANIIMGQSPSSDSYNQDHEGLPFHQGVAGFGVRFPVNEMWCREGTRFANAGDILFSVRAPVGRINVSKEKIVIGRGLSAISEKRGFQGWLLYALKSYFTTENMIGSGCIFASTTKTELFDVKLPYPEESLIKKFNAIVQSIDDDLVGLDNQIRSLTEARDRLLPKLMSGEVAV